MTENSSHPWLQRSSWLWTTICLRCWNLYWNGFDFIEEVEVFEGQQIDVDLDQTHEHNVGKPYGDIRRWYNYIFAGMWADLKRKIIDVEADVKGNPYVLVNRTQRYYNPMGSYAFLRNIGIQIIFAGTPDEYEAFQREVPEARYLEVDNFLELAGWIKGSTVLYRKPDVFCHSGTDETPSYLEV